jgi:transposase InsO family protein
MPWKEAKMKELRQEFVQLALREGANKRELCQRYGITPRTGYKWIQRSRSAGEEGLKDHSRRPKHSPNRTANAVEAAVVAERERHPAWGGRKIKARLEQKEHRSYPSASTLTAILRRHEQIDPEQSSQHRPYQRFEMAAPNQLWQIDFKGYFGLSEKGDFCHPLTVLDDHSRFLVGLQACPNETQETVQERLTHIFRRYGLPERMLMDNGSPWGDDRETPYTAFGAWLIRLGIQISHGRPYHPQTQGKDERLHRTLLAEVISRATFASLAACQTQFDDWRHMYNFERPHEALALQPPASRYQASSRPFPEILPPIAYPTADYVRKVDASGKISFHNRAFRIGKAFRHYLVGLQWSQTEQLYNVYFCSCRVTQLDPHS